MDKKNQVVFAAAGHGKTYSICMRAREALKHTTKCVLLISYTNQGMRALESEYRKQNYGVLDDRIVLKSWYSFLLSEFIKPYQCLLKLKYKYYKKEYNYPVPENFVSSIAFYDNSQPAPWYNQSHIQYFFNKNRDVVPDRVSQLAFLCNQHSTGKALARLEQLYSHIYIDELQDYAGWDLEIIKLLFESKSEILCVGDFKQATYRTNRSPKNSQYRDEKIRNYFLALQKKKQCTVAYANTTRRFNSDICSFINQIHKDVESRVIVEEDSFDGDTVDNTGVYIIDNAYLNTYADFYHPVILKYNKNSSVEFLNDCIQINYGAAKGATYDRTIIIPLPSVIPFLEKGELELKDQTKAKFYVACTRAKFSMVFAVDKPNPSNGFTPTKMKIGSSEIPALKYTPRKPECS